MKEVKLSKTEEKKLQELEKARDDAQKALDDFKLKVGVICDHPADQCIRAMGILKCTKCDMVIG